MTMTTTPMLMTTAFRSGALTSPHDIAHRSAITDSATESSRRDHRWGARVRPRLGARLETSPHPNPLTGATPQRLPTSRVGPDEPDNPGGFSPGRGGA
ncbi:hypothetical protein GCM10009662_60620 [Catellatospora coxensis]